MNVCSRLNEMSRCILFILMIILLSLPPPHPPPPPPLLLSPEWDHGSCCKSYRGNKRCLVLKYRFHAASPERFPPYRCAIRVIPQFRKTQPRGRKERRRKKKLTPSLWFIVLSSGPLRHRFSLSGLFRC